MIKISLGLYVKQTPAEIVVAGKLADARGFDTLWLSDSDLPSGEIHTLLGALAASTERIQLGAAMTYPLTGHPVVAISVLAAISAVNGSRAALGIRIGDTTSRAMNDDLAKTMALEEAVARCRALLTGERAVCGTNCTAEPAAPELPIYIAASGPKMLHLAGRIADGVILMNGVTPEIIGAAIILLRRGEAEQGREPGSTKVAVWAACHTNYQAVKRSIARTLLRDIPGPVDELTRVVADDVRGAYKSEQDQHADVELSRLIPDELVPRFAFSGSPKAIKEQIDALRGLGVDEVILAIPPEDQFASREDVIRDLMPLLTTSPHRRGYPDLRIVQRQAPGWRSNYPDGFC
jgi:5,10-methylenetetrahydromethanopterin reductase